MQYALPVQQNHAKQRKSRESENVDDARISGPKRPPFSGLKVFFGESILYPQMELTDRIIL